MTKKRKQVAAPKPPIFESVLRIRSRHGALEKEFIVQHGDDVVRIVEYGINEAIVRITSGTLDQLARALKNLREQESLRGEAS